MSKITHTSSSHVFSASRRSFFQQCLSFPLASVLASSVWAATPPKAAPSVLMASEEPERKITTGILTADLKDQRPTKIFWGHKDFVRSAIFNRDGTQILTASTDQTAILWDVATCKPIQVFQSSYQEPFVEAIFSRGGRGVVTRTEGHTTTFWDLHGRKRQEFRGNCGRSNFPSAFNPINPQEVTAPARNYGVYIIDTQTGTHAARCVGHRAPITTIAFSRDATRLLTGSLDQTVIVWDYPAKDLRGSQGMAMVLPRRNTIYAHSPVLAAAFGPDNETVLFGMEDHTIVLRELTYGEKIRTFYLPNQRIQDVAMSDTGSILVAAGTIVALWENRGTRT